MIKITLLKIFVASPGDVADERSVLKQVIDELNLLLVKTRGIQLDLVKWETHSYPNIGEDTQSVINEQIGEEYDIFVGILWKHFGAPTKKAMSGTEEEFDRAYNRFKKDPNQLRVMIYFNEAPVSPSELDPEQFMLIRKFQSELGKKGVLYWTYTAVDEFASLVRIHLSQHINDFGKTWGKDSEEPQVEIAIPEEEPQKIEDDEEEGFLDLLEVGTDNFETSTEILKLIAQHINELGEKTSGNVNELNNLPKPVNAKQAKRIINKSAEDLEHFSERMNAEVPRLTKTYSLAIKSYARAVELWPDFDLEDKSDIEDALDVVKGLKQSLFTLQESISEFRSSISRMPRITTRYRRAKRNSLAATDNFLDEMTRYINITIEVEKVMERVFSSGEDE